MPFKGLKHDEIDITKVSSLPRLEIEDQYHVLYEERAQLSKRVPWNENL